MPDHEVILHYAEDIDADLIMIMTHQESGFRDHYIGKFAHKIINGSEIPVMTMVPAALPKQKRIVKSFIDPFEIFGVKNNNKPKKK